MFSKSHVLAAFALLIVSLLAGTPLLTAAAPEKPNIVFIMADDLGYGELGCYGQKQIQTPHIDRIATEGLRFTQCHAGSHVCAPSRSTLMTGLHSGHTPVRANGLDRHLYDADVTVAEVLHDAGYQVGGFGKWGLGQEHTPGFPPRQGFDEFFGFYNQMHAHFFYPFWVFHNEKKVMLPENENNGRGSYIHDVIHREALRFIRENKDGPFFAYLPYTIPHVELVVPEDSVKPYRGKFPEFSLPDPRAGYIGSEEPLATFAGMVSRLDAQVGEVMSLLKELGIDDNTIVFFTSDNGGQGGAWARMTDYFEGNGPFRGHKGSYYEGGIRVPMIVRWPGKIAAGAESDHVMAFWDFLPTAAELAGVKFSGETDGISIVPTLFGRAGQQKEHEFLYWAYPASNDRLTRAVRWKDWKAVQSKPDGAYELYDLASDVGEKSNIAAEHPDVIGKIKEFAAKSHTPERDYPPAIPRTVGDYVR